MYGNRTIGNKTDVSNPYNLTGPGFTETLVGFADPAVNSNKKMLNKSTNVLEFINSQEAMIASLWNYIQSIPQYKDKTTLLIACDHSRGGQVKSQWTDHGTMIPDSKNIFILAMGPDMPALGEVNTATQLYQGQMAATIAKFLGLDYVAEHPVMPVITTMFKK